jgi:protein-export membrane protein SecD
MNVRRSLLMIFLVVAVLLGMYIPILIGGYSPRLGLDLQGGLSVTLQAVDPNASSDQMSKAADIVRRRVNALGLTEPVVAPQGNNRILVQIPGEQDPDRVLSIIGSTAQLQFREVLQIIYPSDPAYEETPITDINPEDSEAYRALKDQEIVLEYAADEGVLKVKLGPTRLTGDIIQSADAAVDTEKGGYKIDFKLTGEATPQFAALTQELLNKQLAIVLDYKLESFPTVQSAITNGAGVISGNFDRQRARDLAMVLKVGALPVEFKKDPLVENISATLGRDSLHRGLMAGLIGLILVLLYMLAMYRGLGLVTCLSLSVFGLLMYGIVVLLGHFISWSLTLAGIAGIVVSIGISADSSVVYFERLKEEVREGKTLRSSADRAFKAAWRTMVTADATTFITAFILWILSIGPVKGFAFTLGIATIIDLFVMYLFTHSVVFLVSRLDLYNRPRLVGVGREAEAGEA